MDSASRSDTYSGVKIWFLAARPRTLSAALMPVMAGSALAFSESSLNPAIAAVTLVCALLLQIGSNFANDLFDYISGADTNERKGPMRVVARGLVTPAQMKRATVIVFSAAFVTGLYLVSVGGLPILIIGIVSIITAIAYTGGPYPLGYNGWGDLMAFLFFGLIATIGTYYLQTLHVTLIAFIVSIPVGALITNILIVNNYRDIETDEKSGKRTMAVIFGKKFARMEFRVLLITAYAVPIFLLVRYEMSFWILLPLLSLPFAYRISLMLKELEGRDLNQALEKTAKLVAIFGLLYAVGISL